MLAVNPATNWQDYSDAVIGWKSPIAGAVYVTFSLTDLQPTGLAGSDGVGYQLFKDAGATPLASGTMTNGGGTGTIAVSVSRLPRAPCFT